MKKTKIKLYLGFLLLAIGGVLSKIDGMDNLAAASSSVTWQKPSWPTDLSAGVMEGCDNSITLPGVDLQYSPSVCTVPSGSVAGLKDR